ncbi:MAG TPA: hypothetical protein VMS17_26660 [Gemmataceae bacterium]|nr:hypothetical protein [Gemmataceae bacterium]
MPPNYVVALLKGAIPLLCGLYATLQAYRLVGKKPGQDPGWDRWHKRFGALLKVAGPLVMASGVVMFFVFLRTPATPPADWRRYTLADGTCSAEFPAAPHAEGEPPPGQPASGLEVNRDGGALYYFVRDTQLSAAVPEGHEEQALDQARDNMRAGARQSGRPLDVVRERALTLDGAHGRELECAGGSGFTVTTRLFVRGGTIYQIAATTPSARKDEEEPRRFLESFRFEQQKK